GLIEFEDKSSLTSVPHNVVKNTKALKFREIEAASLPRVLDDVDCAIINGNYAIPAGLVASRDGLLVEGSDSPYVNVITVKEGMENDSRIKVLLKALQSEKVKKYIAETYPNGEVVSVF
ncbi:MAG: methionine ABC transporter substrate-binding protein, partial [Treponema sp.]|nr:methionine ABC transporter substrate-binding protein [Treponema sp.]